jgi:hypothetical protein
VKIKYSFWPRARARALKIFQPPQAKQAIASQDSKMLLKVPKDILAPKSAVSTVLYYNGKCPIAH